jgi:hypothetical protein
MRYTTRVSGKAGLKPSQLPCGGPGQHKCVITVVSTTRRLTRLAIFNSTSRCEGPLATNDSPMAFCKYSTSARFMTCWYWDSPPCQALRSCAAWSPCIRHHTCPGMFPQPAEHPASHVITSQKVPLFSDTCYCRMSALNCNTSQAFQLGMHCIGKVISKKVVIAGRGWD